MNFQTITGESWAKEILVRFLKQTKRKCRKCIKNHQTSLNMHLLQILVNFYDLGITLWEILNSNQYLLKYDQNFPQDDFPNMFTS